MIINLVQIMIINLKKVVVKQYKSLSHLKKLKLKWNRVFKIIKSNNLKNIDVTIKILDRDEDVDVMQSTAEALTLLKKKYQEIQAK